VSEAKVRVNLREVIADDLPQFFSYLRDPGAASMADIADDDPNDQPAFEGRWAKMLRDPQVTARTIELSEEKTVVGYVLGFPHEGQNQVSYWVDRGHWGRGIATAALSAFLAEVTHRPIYARAPKHNQAAVVVLRRNGFNLIGDESGYIPERGRVVDELVLVRN